MRPLRFVNCILMFPRLLQSYGFGNANMQRGEILVKDKELKAKIACEIALYLLRKAVREGIISAVEYEKAAKSFVDAAL